jgi:hypothetical protein
MKKVSFVIIVLGIAFTACKKSKVEEPSPESISPAVGLWKGKYYLNTNIFLGYDVIYLFRKDGTMGVYNGTDTTTASAKGIGIWKLVPPTDIVSEYYYIGSPTNFFSSKIGADALYTVAIAAKWGTGKLISNPNSFVESGGFSSFRKQ